MQELKSNNEHVIHNLDTIRQRLELKKGSNQTIFNTQEQHDGNKIKVERFTTEASQVILNYDKIVSLHSSSKNGIVVDLVNDIPLLDMVPLSLQYNSSRILVFLKLLKPQPCYKVDVVIPRAITNPVRMSYTNFGYMGGDDYTGENSFVSPKQRYIWNHSIHQLYGIGKYERDSKSLKMPIKIDHERGWIHHSRVEGFITSGYGMMVRKLGVQNRFADMETSILSMMLTLQEITHNAVYEWHPDKDTVPKRGVDLIGMQFIAAILSQHSVFPYRYRNDAMSVRDYSRDFSTSLPGILAALLQLSLYELTCEISHNEANSLCTNLMAYSARSVYQDTLDRKGILRKHACEAYLSAPTFRLFRRDENGAIINTVDVHGFTDFEYEKKKQEIADNEKLLTSSERKVLAHARSIRSLYSDSSPARNTEMARYIIRLIRSATSNGLFNKTSPRLEYEKSSRPRRFTTVNGPTVKTYCDVDGILVPDILDYSKTPFGELYDDYCSNFKTSIINELSTYNPEHEFYNLLTNKKQGDQPGSENIPTSLKKIANQRAVAAVIHREHLYTFESYYGSINSVTTGATRSQVQRRARNVQMVSNQIQAAQLPNILFSNVLKPMDDSIAVGKQFGDVRNARDVLIGTGLLHLLSSMDVEAMDAHTLPQAADFVNYVAREPFRDINTTYQQRYMWVTAGIYDIVRNITGRPEIPTYEYRNPVYIYAATTNHAKTNQRLQLEDPFFKGDGLARYSMLTFASGAWGTTHQHTYMLTTTHRVHNAHFNIRDRAESGKPSLQKFFLASGDDMYERIIIDYQDAHMVQRADSYLKSKMEYLNTFNYSVTTDFSFVTATFLQLQALCGVLVPYHDRLTVFTEEKGEVYGRSTIERVKNALSLVRTYAQRSSSTNNCRSLGMSIWNVMRRENIYKNTAPFAAKEYSRYFHQTSDVSHLVYPYMLVSFSPFYFPMPSYKLNDRIIGGSSMATPSCDVGWILINELVADYSNIERPTKHWTRDFLVTTGMGLYGLVQQPEEEITLADRRKEEVAEFAHAMEQVYINVQDPIRRMRSHMAKSRILEMGGRVPKGVAYVDMPAMKVEQSLVTVKPSGNEADRLTDLRRESIIQFKPHMPNEYQKLINLFTFHAVPVDVAPTSLDATLMKGFPPIPAYHVHDDFGVAYAGHGGVCRTENKSRDYIGSLKVLSDKLGGFDRLVEYAHHIDTSIFRGTPEGRATISDLFGMSKNLQQTFWQYVDSAGLVDYGSSYKTYMNDIEFMDLTKSRTPARDMFSATSCAYNQQMHMMRLFNKYIAIFDDCFRAISHRNTTATVQKYEIRMHPYSYHALATGSKLEAFGRKRFFELYA